MCRGKTRLPGVLEGTEYPSCDGEGIIGKRNSKYTVRTSKISTVHQKFFETFDTVF